jgi:hypothetical protein
LSLLLQLLLLLVLLLKPVLQKTKNQNSPLL